MALEEELRLEWLNFCKENENNCLNNEDTIFFLSINDRKYLFIGIGLTMELCGPLEEEYFFWDESTRKIDSQKWRSILQNFGEGGTKQKYFIYGGSIFKQAPFLAYWSFNSFKQDFPFPVYAIYNEETNEISHGIMNALKHVRSFYRTALRLPYGELEFYFDFQDVSKFPPNHISEGENLWLSLLYSIAKDFNAKFFKDHEERIDFFKGNKNSDLFISFYHNTRNGLQCGENDYIEMALFNSKKKNSINPILGLHCGGKEQLNSEVNTFSILNEGNSLQWEYLMYVSKVFYEAIKYLPQENRVRFLDKTKDLERIHTIYIGYFKEKIKYGMALQYSKEVAQLRNEFRMKGYIQ